MAYILASMSLTSSYYYLVETSIRNSVCLALLLCILRARIILASGW